MTGQQHKPLYDFMVIGGGILGMSTAMQLQQRYPGCSVLVLEKEAQPAQHQTGRNSGVIHAGVYYKPGSLKATFCKAGNRRPRRSVMNMASHTMSAASCWWPPTHWSWNGCRR